jgi:hypothetical protein
MRKSQLPTELESFQLFVRDQLANGGRDVSPEESVRAWRKQYKDELKRLKAELQVAAKQSARGESFDLDLEKFLQQGRERLARKGIVE